MGPLWYHIGGSRRQFGEQTIETWSPQILNLVGCLLVSLLNQPKWVPSTKARPVDEHFLEDNWFLALDVMRAMRSEAVEARCRLRESISAHVSGAPMVPVLVALSITVSPIQGELPLFSGKYSCVVLVSLAHDDVHYPQTTACSIGCLCDIASRIYRLFSDSPFGVGETRDLGLTLKDIHPAIGMGFESIVSPRKQWHLFSMARPSVV